MLFVEYNEQLKKYKNSKKCYYNLLEHKARIYLKTQPKSVQLEDDYVNNGSKNNNRFLLFVIELEKNEKELQDAKNELELQKFLLEEKEKELKESDELLDIIYLDYFIKKEKVNNIAKKINYSREQTYRYIKKIKKYLNMTQKDTNFMI